MLKILQVLIGVISVRKFSFPVTVSHAQRKLSCMKSFHKTWKYVLIENAILLKWKSQGHMKRLLRDCCKTKLCRMVSHNFIFIGNASIFSLEDSQMLIFLRNICICQRVYATSQTRTTTTLLSSPQSEPQISLMYWALKELLVKRITWNEFHAALLHETSFMLLVSSGHDLRNRL